MSPSADGCAPPATGRRERPPRASGRASQDAAAGEPLTRGDGHAPEVTESLAGWFTAHGRHHLPWRRTRDPWVVLVSEVMLQQTSVARVLGRWERFIDRWPSPESCAAAALGDVLAEWEGLGYPRRALRLWRTAQALSAAGWPADEAGLRALPGVGAYTARALLCFALGSPAGPPRDVNLSRVAARCFGGAEHLPAASLDALITRHRPVAMGEREYAYALFDVGALLCRRGSVACRACPLAGGCRSRDRLAAGVPAAPRRQPAYPGSMRELRGAVLRSMLARPGLSFTELEASLGSAAAARRPGAVAEALAGLRLDGLLS